MMMILLSCTTIILLTLQGDNWLRLLDIVNPAVENNLSEGALVAGIASKDIANFERRGNVSV